MDPLDGRNPTSGYLGAPDLREKMGSEEFKAPLACKKKHN